MDLSKIMIMNASWLSVLVISFTLFFSVMYWSFLLPVKKAQRIGIVTAITASFAMTAVMYRLVDQIGLMGSILIVFMWVLPATIVWIKREYFKGLDQRKLIALQIFRLIGALFILEMWRGNIPGSFALPAGIGDILVGSIALYLVLRFKKIPRWGVVLVLATGLIDFAVAFFFGFTSLPGPGQVFAKGFANQVNLFPTGMIPLFLVPYAIVFHILSFINLETDLSFKKK